jgi:hypothetical protein
MARERQWGEAFPINADGTFRLDDLAPGKYSVQLRMLGTENHFGIDLITAFTEFEIPPLPAGKERVDEPLDVGTIRVKTCPRLQVGKPAPEFTVTALDGGKPIKLSDFRGRTVVLKWWWNWSRMETEAKAVNKAYESIKDDPTVVLLTLAFDQEIATARKRVADWEIGGVHAYVGADYTKVMPPEYFGSPATVCIIDADGKVLAKSLDVEGLDTEIAKVLLER